MKQIIKLFVFLFVVVGGILSVLAYQLGFFGNETDAAEEEVISPLELYAELIVEVTDDSNKLLATYSAVLDNLYSNKVTDGQAQKIVDDLIPDSNKILRRLDEQLYDIETGLYEYHSDLIGLMNYQHQMLLITMDMLRDPESNTQLRDLRDMYVTTKQDQTIMVQRIKTLFEDLSSPEVEE